MGFGLGVGVIGAQILFLLLGLAFFIPGLMLIRRGRDSKTKTIQSDTDYYGGIVLLVLGIVLMGGLGFSTLLDSLDF